MLKKSILLGTRSLGKEAEFKLLLKSLLVNIISLRDYKIDVDIDEDECTLEGNAIKKSLTYAKSTGLITISDDSGLYVKALNGKPGIQVRRWEGELDDNISDKEWLRFFLEKMKSISPLKRTASFRTVFAISHPSGFYETTECISEFIVAEKPQYPITPGEPVNSVRFIPKFGKMYNDLTDIEKLEIHRGTAKTKLICIIKKYLEM